MRLTATLAALSVLASAACGQLHPPTGDADYDVSNAALFHEGDLVTIQVAMAPGDLNAMMADPWSDIEYACTARISNKVLDEMVPNIRIKIRGSTSRNALKKSFRLSFNSVTKGLRFHGVKKLNIVGDQNDVAIVRAKLALDALRAFGLPAQRAVTVHFRINDGARVNDIYVGEEPMNNDVMNAWFGSDTGNFYKCSFKNARADLRYVEPGDAAAYQTLGGGETYVEDNNTDNPNFTDLADFIRFINKSSDADFAARLSEHLDVEGFLRNMAADVVLGQWDNCWYGANNFYLYHNPATDRFEYVPYDYDNTLGLDFFSVDWANRPLKNWGSGGFGSNPDIPPLIRRVLQVPAWEGQLRRYVREFIGAPRLRETVFNDASADTFCSPANPQLDILSADVTNDAGYLYIALQLAGPLDMGPGADMTQFLLFFDTVPEGVTSNPWGRAIANTVTSDFCMGAWANAGGGFQFYQATGSRTGYWVPRYTSAGTTGGITMDMTASQSGAVRFSIPLAVLGIQSGQAFKFDIATMQNRSMGLVPGVDHLSSQTIATPDFDTPSTPGEFLSYTVQADAGVSPNAVFSFATMGPKADALKALAQPYAYKGATAGPTMDWNWTAAEFDASFDSPTSYRNTGRPWNWGIKPYIAVRAAYLVGNVPSPASQPPIFINEVLALNTAVNRDEAGRYGDWVELYNASADTIGIGGMYLSNDPSQPRKWRIPDGTTIAGKGFALIWADEQSSHGPLHASFSISAAGQTVALSGTDANLNVMVDSLVCPATGADESYGRFPDGAEACVTFTTVTPTAPNDTTPRTITLPPLPPLFINEFMASNSSTITDEYGEHDDWIEIYNGGLEPVDLGGLFLSDSLSNPAKFRIADGTFIESGGHMLFWADDVSAQGPRHMPYKLSAGGEQIGLFDREEGGMRPIDTLTFGAQATDVSMGRPCDGETGMVAQPRSSPGAANGGATCSPVCPTFTEDPNAGTVPAGRALTLSFSAAGTVPMDIQWRKGDADIADSATVKGARSQRLVFSAVAPADAGEYRVVLTNACGPATSHATTLVVRAYTRDEARVALSLAAGLADAQTGDLAALDANQDGVVDVIDAAAILRSLAG